MLSVQKSVSFYFHIFNIYIHKHTHTHTHTHTHFSPLIPWPTIYIFLHPDGINTPGSKFHFPLKCLSPTMADVPWYCGLVMCNLCCDHIHVGDALKPQGWMYVGPLVPGDGCTIVFQLESYNEVFFCSVNCSSDTPGLQLQHLGSPSSHSVHMHLKSGI
jgi:hypothetical protein